MQHSKASLIVSVSMFIDLKLTCNKKLANLKIIFSMSLLDVYIHQIAKCKIFGTLLGFTLQPHVKILPIYPYFSVDILKI